ncbi:DMT family transporter [Sandaracinus amylolyticus]|uniref:Integral membrane protein n=1 Tax=Sandaracinus amylolyticus TaxID=927083 RepID=A0A0F6VZS8_9BACT|nr:DMT family transporter [Sandaracinus amylolyticus]AKF03811.1 Integral membrane protein [Sandaracinus amylolyticus]
MSDRDANVSGALYALAAGLLWGLVFVVPLLLPEYPAVALSFGRYVAFGVIAIPLAWLDRAQLRGLSRADWIEATKLALVGNVLYYLCLAAAIQRAGAPLPTMIIGTLPVVIALVSNARGERVAWSRLAPSLALIATGIALVNRAEWQALRADPSADPRRYAIGGLLAIGALVCWTWYPIRNAAWLRASRARSASTWATAQGVVTLPIAAIGYAGFVAWSALSGTGEFPLPLGPTPSRFVFAMLAVGLLASWMGATCWNRASQRLPTQIAGQLIVFETLAALSYAFVLRGRLPDAMALAGIVLLVVGVAWALRSPRSTPIAPLEST